MTDRELLKLAAKAYGIGKPAYVNDSGSWVFIDPNTPNWNPLTNDGDALRLAVSLGLCIMQDRDTVQVSYSDGGEFCKAFAMEQTNSSEGATRRAIVRAAAEIGKTK
jgi:hypothetical protein